MGSRDLFVVMLRGAGLLLLWGIVVVALQFLVPGRGDFDASAVGAALLVPALGLVAVWLLMGAPSLTARLRWPDPPPGGNEPAPPPCAWAAAAERTVGWLALLGAVPEAGHVLTTLAGVFDRGGPPLRGLWTDAALWIVLASVGFAVVLFRRSSRTLGVEP